MKTLKAINDWVLANVDFVCLPALLLWIFTQTCVATVFRDTQGNVVLVRIETR